MFDHAKYKEEVNYLGSKREKKSQTDISEVIVVHMKLVPCL